MTSIFRWLSYCYSLFSGSNCRGQIEYVIRNVILSFSFSFSFSTKTTQHDKTFEIRYLIHYTKSNYISNMINVCRLDSFFFSFFGCMCEACIFGAVDVVVINIVVVVVAHLFVYLHEPNYKKSNCLGMNCSTRHYSLDF